MENVHLAEQRTFTINMFLKMKHLTSLVLKEQVCVVCCAESPLCRPSDGSMKTLNALKLQDNSSAELKVSAGKTGNRFKSFLFSLCHVRLLKEDGL